MKLIYFFFAAMLLAPIYTQGHSHTPQTPNNHQKMDTLTVNLDGFKKAHWSEQEAQNVELITDFVQNLMNNHDFSYVLEKFSNQAYRQHNRGIPDGFEALVGYVEEFTKRYPDYGYDVKHVYADGDFVIFQSHVTIKKKHRGNDKKGFIIKDTWKIEDGEIVEHWDAIQPIDGFMRFVIWMTGGKIRNSNGLF